MVETLGKHEATKSLWQHKEGQLVEELADTKSLFQHKEEQLVEAVGEFEATKRALAEQAAPGQTGNAWSKAKSAGNRGRRRGTRRKTRGGRRG